MTTFNAKTNLSNFGRSLGNGATMGALFCDGVLHAIETQNTNHIAAMFSKAKAKEDMQAMRVIKALLSPYILVMMLRQKLLTLLIFLSLL